MVLLIKEIYLVLELSNGLLVGFMYVFDIKLFKVLATRVHRVHSLDFILSDADLLL
jgi:hypothetical protein